MSRALLGQAERQRRRKAARKLADALNRENLNAYARAWRVKHPGYSTPYAQKSRAKRACKPLTNT